MQVKGLAIAIIIGALLILSTGIDVSGLGILKLVPVVIQLVPPPIYIASVASVGGRSAVYNIKTAGFVYIDPCLWNLDTSDPRVRGYTLMNLTMQGLVVVSNYSYVAGKGNDWFRDFIGFHRVGYGNHPWESKPYVNPSSYLPLPVRVRDLPNIFIEVNYSIIERRIGWMDIAFDIWLKRSPPPYRGMARGDVEIMMWLYREPPLPGGALEVGTVRTLALVNGSLKELEWVALIVPEVVEPSPGGWTWIIFVSRHPIPGGSIVLNLNNFLEEAKRIIMNINWATKPSWSEEIFNNMYLWCIEFGSEVARTGSGALHLKWVLHRYSFLIMDRDVDISTGFNIIAGYVASALSPITITKTATDITTLTISISEAVTVTASKVVREIVTYTALSSKTITVTSTSIGTAKTFYATFIGGATGFLLALILCRRVRK
jgi:hypothetical protein